MPRRAGSIVRTTAGKAGSAFQVTGGSGGAGGISEKSAWIRRTPTPSTCRTPQLTSRATEERLSLHSKARPEETTTTNFGLIRTSRDEWLSAATKARL